MNESASVSGIHETVKNVIAQKSSGIIALKTFDLILFGDIEHVSKGQAGFDFFGRSVGDDRLASDHIVHVGRLGMIQVMGPAFKSNAGIARVFTKTDDPL